MEKEHGEGDEGLSGVDHGSDNGARFHGYHDLMRFRVRDILLVASLYDAFILEEDGRLSEQLYGEYKDLDLSSPPRITRVSTPEEAFEELRMRRYDMVVTMTKLVDMDPFKFGKTVKEHQHGIPVILLVTDISDLGRFHNPGHYGSVDKVFFWSGDSALLLAIPKYVEDMVNVGPDTEEGMVGVLLVIENSARYYSMFLSLIYSEIMRQTQSLVSDSLNDHEKLLRRRARPKIILAETFEEGLVKYNLYKEHMLGVITDVTYPRDGKDDEEAGFRFIEAVDTDIPILLQSSHAEHGDRAAKMNVPFLDKRSDTLLQGIRDFFNENLGFGDFVFRMPDGGEAGRASNMAEFIELARKVPVESLRLHAEANSFSNWLMARGEFSLAAKLRPRKLSDFKDEEGMREDLLNAVTESRREKQRGIITDFSQQQFEFEETFTVFGGGSLGGKGRGLAFLNTLLRQGNMRNGLHKCRIRVPDTLVLGADEYDRFIEENGLRDIAKDEPSDKEISRCFSEGELSSDLKSALKNYIQHVRVPVAVRSSSLLEDSQNQPFAGVYSTYLLPNNHGRDGVRLEQLSQAIKLVYASVFYKEARAYIRSTVHKAEEELMAVVIQKIAGNNFGQRFYPVFSGVAQSYNFYPVPPLTREEGTATVALGLGKIVVEGGKAL
ncbi:MAG: hypothetical protein KAT70_01560, partial [Thermoplasmata archaeon]|nr:hypothetical protein [Thermoplasmata archaeon]